MDERAQEVPRDPGVGPQTFDPGPQPAGLVHRKSARVLYKMATFEEASIGPPRLAKEAHDVKRQRQEEQQARMDKGPQIQKVRQSHAESLFLIVSAHRK